MLFKVKMFVKVNNASLSGLFTLSVVYIFLFGKIPFPFQSPM